MKNRLALGLACASLAIPLWCATLQQLSFNDMAGKSTAIVRGKVGSSHSAFSGSVIYTHYAVQVSEQFKGSGPSTIDVAVPGGAAKGLRQTFSGAPALRSGEEYVLFLWTGPSGLTQVVGLTQGLYLVSRDGSADPIAARPASHELMLAPGTGQPVADQAVSMRLSQLRSRIASALADSRSAK